VLGDGLQARLAARLTQPCWWVDRPPCLLIRTVIVGMGIGGPIAQPSRRCGDCPLRRHWAQRHGAGTHRPHHEPVFGWEGCRGFRPRMATAEAERIGAAPCSDGAALIGAGEIGAIMMTSLGRQNTRRQRSKPAGSAFCENLMAPRVAVCVPITGVVQKSGRRLVQVWVHTPATRATGRCGQCWTGGDRRGADSALRVRNPAVPEVYTAHMTISDTAIHLVDTIRQLLVGELCHGAGGRPRRSTGSRTCRTRLS
jgi:hypothetical protein